MKVKQKKNGKVKLTMTQREAELLYEAALENQIEHRNRGCGRSPEEQAEMEKLSYALFRALGRIV